VLVLARTIVALGDMLALRTVAEGVEHAAQWKQLAAMGCELGQGCSHDRSTTAHCGPSWPRPRRRPPLHTTHGRAA